jgi:hypothetical protein
MMKSTILLTPTNLVNYWSISRWDLKYDPIPDVLAVVIPISGQSSQSVLLLCQMATPMATAVASTPNIVWDSGRGLDL